MTIQFNADNNLTVHEDFRTKLKDQITGKLNRFAEHISRVEVHLSDDNGAKKGQNDKKCLLEARVEGRPPVVVTGLGDNYELAVAGALDKMRTTLDKVFDKLQNR